MADFESRVQAALIGGAIGDGIGAPVEGFLRARILEAFGPVRGFLPPTVGVDGRPQKVDRPDGKGDGRITDDTLMVEALIAAYMEEGDHLTAWDYRHRFAPAVATRPVWLPEFQREMVLLDRLAGAEQLQIRALLRSPRDPRFFGALLHVISCGGAMCAWPVGAVNAGDPRAAYDEAVGFFSAQTFSFGLEQAAVMAAAMAEALAPDATPRSVVDAALALAKDGTAAMIRAAVDALAPGADRDRDLPAVHRAVQPFHHKRGHEADTDESEVAGSGRAPDAGLESRARTSEELPVALAMLVRADGDFRETVCASAEYGEDADSIAGMAGSLAGALGGLGAIPEDWAAYAQTQNRRDYVALGRDFAARVRAIADGDAARTARRREAVGGRRGQGSGVRGQ